MLCLTRLNLENDNDFRLKVDWVSETSTMTDLSGRDVLTSPFQIYGVQAYEDGNGFTNAQGVSVSLIVLVDHLSLTVLMKPS